MKKLIFSNRKGLSKSTINNHQSSIGIGIKLRSLLFLAVAIMVSGNVWGYYKTNLYVYSTPSQGGFVYANSKNEGPSSYTLTTDNASAEGGGMFTYEGNITMYMFQKTNPGYTFKGWSTSSTATSGDGASSNPYSKSLSASKRSSGGTTHNYYAIFAANSYTVNFNANGGSVSPTSKSVTYASTYGELPTPTWANHRFDGWFTSSSGGTQVTASTTVSITANQDLYAHWTNIYSGTFYSYSKDEGQTWITVKGTEFTGNFTQKNDYSTTSFTQNNPPTFPVECYAKAATGYTFAGWYDNESCTGMPISTSTDTWCKLEDNVTATQLVTTKKYYAKFTPGVTYYVTAYSEARPKVAGIGLHYISCQGNNPTSDDKYTASDKQDNSNNKITTQTSSGTIRGDFYAKALTGYKFMGWYSDEACTQLAGAGDPNDRNHYVENIESTITTSPGKVITRYAKFDPISYKVRFMANTGSGTMSDQTFNYNEQKALTTNQYTKTGWDFAGWATSEGGAVVYTDGKEVKNLSSTQGDVIILYAKWTIHTWTLTWAGIDGATLSGNYTPAGTTNYGTALTAPTVRKYGWKFTSWNPSVPATMPDANSTYTAQWAGVTVSAASNSPTVNFTNRTETKTATITFPVTNATEAADFKTPSVSGDGWTYKSFSYASNVVSVVVEFVATENTTTRGNHVSTVTVEGKNGNKNTGTVTASVHMTPSYSSTIAATYLVDDAAIDLNTLWTSSSNGSKKYTITKFSPSSSVNPGLTSAPEITGTMLSLGQAGTVELLLTQGAGTSSEASSDTRSLVINKYTPEFSWNSQTYYFNSSYADIFSSSNSNTQLTFTTSNSSVADMKIGSASNKGTLKTYNGTGSADITVSQAENYKWAPKSQTFSGISLTKTSNHLEMYITSEAAFNNYKGELSRVSWTDNTIEFNSVGIFDGSTVRRIEFNFTGIPDKLTGKLSTEDGAQTAHWVWKQKVNNNWEDLSAGKGDTNDDIYINEQLNPSATAIRLEFSNHVYAGYLDLLKVTELQYFRRQGSGTIDFGINQQGSTAEVKSFVVEHCNAGYQTGIKAPAQYQISFNANSGFTDTLTYSTNADPHTGGDSIGTFTVYVKSLTSVVGPHGGDVVVSNNLRGKINVPVTSNIVTKYTPQITRPSKVEYYVADPSIDLNTLWTSTGGPRTYTRTGFTPTGETYSGEVEPTVTNGILTLGKAGKVYLHMDIAETPEFNPGSDDIEITIIKHTPQYSWTDQTNYYGSSAYADIFVSDNSDMPLNFATTDNSVAEMVIGTSSNKGTLKTYNYRDGASATITVSQQENYKWYSQSKTYPVALSKAKNHVPFTYDNAMFNDGNVTISKSGLVEWTDSRLLLGSGSSNVHNESIVVVITGVPDIISLEYKIYDDKAKNITYSVYQSETGADGSWGSAVWSSTSIVESWQSSGNVQLSPNTKYLMLKYNGAYGGYYRNITVTELQRFSSATSSIDFETNKLDVEKIRSFVVDHANAGYQTSVKSLDPQHYLVSIDGSAYAEEVVYSTNATAKTGGDKYGSFTVNVKYLANAEGTHNSAIQVKNNLREDFEVAVKGVTQGKLTTTATWTATKAYNKGMEADIASSFSVKDDNGKTVAGTWSNLQSNNEYAFVIQNGKAIATCGKVDDTHSNQATITGTFTPTNTSDYKSCNGSVTLTVNLKEDAISWSKSDIHVWADNPNVTNIIPYNVATAHTRVYYGSGNPSQLTVVNGATIEQTTFSTGNANAGGVTLSATSEGDCEWNKANSSITVYVDSCKHEIKWDQTFLHYVADQTGYIDEWLDLTAYAVDSQYVETHVAISYTIISGNDVAEISGGRLHLKKNGNAKIRATTASSDKYATASAVRDIKVRKEGEACGTTKCFTETYTISASNKQDVSITFPMQTIQFNYKNAGEWIENNKVFYVYVDDGNGNFTNKVWECTYHNMSETDQSTSIDVSQYPSARKIRFDWTNGTSGWGYDITISSLCVTQQTYMRAQRSTSDTVSVKSIANPDVKVNTPYSYSFAVMYSDIPVVQYAITNHSGANLQLVPDRTPNNDCGDVNSYTFTLSGQWSTIRNIENDTIKLWTSAGNHISIPINLAINEGSIYRFDNANGTNLWSDKGNWLYGSQHGHSIPGASNPIEVAGHLIVDGQYEAFAVRGIGSNPDKASITIAPNGGLTIHAGGVQTDLNGDSYLNEQNFRIQSSTQYQGYFRISPEAPSNWPMPSATVEFATKATLDKGANKDATWQYFGIPVATETMNVDYITWFYRWSEIDGWTDGGNNVGPVNVAAWNGYCVTQYGQPTYEWKGQLLNGTKTCELTVGGEMQGDNMVANSFASPLDVKKFTKDDFSGQKIDATFYVFNTGSWNNWKQKTDSGQHIINDDAPGSFRAIAILSAIYEDGTIDPTLIAPMQGICIHAKEAGAWVKFDYAKHVWPAKGDAATGMNAGIRAPQRVRKVNDSIVVEPDTVVADPDTLQRRVRLQVYASNSGVDHLYLMQKPEFTMGYDNGYDAPKMMSDGLLNIYTSEEDGQMAISARNSIDSAYIGITAGEDEVYKLTITSVIGDSMVLKDLSNNVELPVVDGQTYTFNMNAYARDDYRFMVYKKVKKDEPFTPTDNRDSQSNAYIWVDGEYLHIEDAAAEAFVGLYASDGKMLMSETINRRGEMAIKMLPTGMYMVYVDGVPFKFVKK